MGETDPRSPGAGKAAAILNGLLPLTVLALCLPVFSRRLARYFFWVELVEDLGDWVPVVAGAGVAAIVLASIFGVLAARGKRLGPLPLILPCLVPWITGWVAWAVDVPRSLGAIELTTSTMSTIAPHSLGISGQAFLVGMLLSGTTLTAAGLGQALTARGLGFGLKSGGARRVAIGAASLLVALAVYGVVSMSFVARFALALAGVVVALAAWLLSTGRGGASPDRGPGGYGFGVAFFLGLGFILVAEAVHGLVDSYYLKSAYSAAPDCKGLLVEHARENLEPLLLIRIGSWVVVLLLVGAMGWWARRGLRSRGRLLRAAISVTTVLVLALVSVCSKEHVERTVMDRAARLPFPEGAGLRPWVTDFGRLSGGQLPAMVVTPSEAISWRGERQELGDLRSPVDRQKLIAFIQRVEAGPEPSLSPLPFAREKVVPELPEGFHFDNFGRGHKGMKKRGSKDSLQKPRPVIREIPEMAVALDTRLPRFVLVNVLELCQAAGINRIHLTGICRPEQQQLYSSWIPVSNLVRDQICSAEIRLPGALEAGYVMEDEFLRHGTLGSDGSARIEHHAKYSDVVFELSLESEDRDGVPYNGHQDPIYLDLGKDATVQSLGEVAAVAASFEYCLVVSSPRLESVTRALAIPRPEKKVVESKPRYYR